MNTALIMFGLAGTAMIGYGIWSYRKPGSESDNRVVIEEVFIPKFLPFRITEDKGSQQTKLSNVSNIWAGSKVYLKNIATQISDH